MRRIITMNKAEKLIQASDALGEVFKVRLMQTDDDEFHLETIDGNVVMANQTEQGIMKQLKDIAAGTDGDGIEDPATIVFELTQAIPFIQRKGQIISQLLRVDPKKFRKLPAPGFDQE